MVMDLNLMTGQRIVARALCFVFLCLVIFCGAASAATITESPDHIVRGGTVTISIHDLRDNAIFSLLIEGRFHVPAGSAFTFETGNFVMPISLRNGEIIVFTENTQKAKFSVKKGGTEASVGKLATENGIFTYTEKRSVSAGTYDWMKISGTVLPEKELVVTRLQLMGSKSGPDDSEISFVVDGIDSGALIITVFVDDTQALFKELTLSSPAQTNPVQTNPVTPIPTGLQNFTSVDSLVSVSARDVSYIGLLKVPKKNVPADWILISDLYTLAPATLSFSPPATISFTIPALPDPSASYAYFIGRYENGQWNAVPSTATSTAIEAMIDRAGTYALMAFIPESRIPAETGAPTAPATVSGATVPAPGTPKIASIAQAVPIATTATAPLSVIAVAGALATGAGLVLRSRKRK